MFLTLCQKIELLDHESLVLCPCEIKCIRREKPGNPIDFELGLVHQRRDGM